MRKQTKLAVGISAAALLAIGASMTSFAARGWVMEGDQWFYYDNNGDYVTDSWKSYNGNYFYLGDDGAMLTSELIDDGGNYYYVDANGVMVKNTWVAVPADDTEDQDVDYRWYYFGATGKAYKDADGKTINGKKYGFDSEAKMLFGFVDTSRTILNDQDDAVINATYYYGTNDDGARHSGWLKYEDSLSNYDADFYWFYFNKNGTKVEGQTKKINGKRYTFNADGVMGSEWNDDATLGAGVTNGYFSTDDDGSLKKNTWFWAIPSENEVPGDYNDDNYRWFRANNDGTLVRGVAKKINGKWYVFDNFGRMKVNLQYLNQETVSGAEWVSSVDRDKVTADDIKANCDAGMFLYFFSADEQRDGSMKTGNNIIIELADDEYTFGFKKNTGVALHGVVNNKLYYGGILQKSDDKYSVVDVTINGATCYFLVSANGTRIKVNHTYKDDNDVFWAVKSGDDEHGYTIGGFKGDDASKDAKDWLNGGTATPFITYP